MTAVPTTRLRVPLIDDDADQLALTRAMLDGDPTFNRYSHES
jgi:hypothetical protein